MTSATALDPAHPGTEGWRIVATADVNQDGVDDIIWQHSDGWLGVWKMDGKRLVDSSFIEPKNANQPGDGLLGVWHMDGLVLRRPEMINTRPSPQLTVRGVGDLNRDRQPDIILQHTNGSTVCWIMNWIQIALQFEIPRVADSRWQVTGPK